MTTHSATYSQPQQLSFVTGWFSAWSELQRQDFAPALAQKLEPRLYVNGLIGGLERLGRPPSIFQCQVKLFQEWSDSWTPEQRAELRARLVAADAEFGRRLEAALAEPHCGEERPTDGGDGDGADPEPAAPDATTPEDPAAPETEQATEDVSIDSQSSELTPTEI
ncbi:uncharacterized protein C14orf119-like [Amphibalanus amphitrite]|uniref:uncharacterized protein C14orf119-like n=1 Tax=Amphibalanus amphitrite TaxID=1232801 RepID=UPI001C919C94|nr:uncharacterized protein C14orf119-like [Amphibalanus amphitrite]XP_043221316.1 uncharacterized protein C14orf119-like [Amphibalanus amphitrite]